jgi:hypothetical protein
MKAGSMNSIIECRTFKGMIRKAAYFLLTFFLTGGTAMCLSAQTNLVLNPSFEDTIKCVNTVDRFQGYVDVWRGTGGEYYNSDCQGMFVEVPANYMGYQYPRTGKAYTGIFTRIVDNIPSHVNARDHIEGQLFSTLINGHNYQVEFYINNSNNNKYVAPIGFKLLNDSLPYGSQYYIGQSPFYMDSSFQRLSDTLNWIKVNSTYRANGDEQFILIGNLLNDSSSSYFEYNSNASLPTCYYYIDDVAVYEISEARPGYSDTICPGDSTQLGEINQPGVRYTWSPGETLSDSTAAFPIAFPTQTTTYTLTIADTSGRYYPGDSVATVTVYVDDCPPPPVSYDFFVPSLLTNDQPFISGNLPPGTTYYLFDARGRLLIRHDNYDNSERASRFAAGLYIWQLHLADGSIQSGKVTILR